MWLWRAAYSASDCASAMQDQTAGGGRMASRHMCLGEVLQQFNQNEIVEHTCECSCLESSSLTANNHAAMWIWNFGLQTIWVLCHFFSVCMLIYGTQCFIDLTN